MSLLYFIIAVALLIIGHSIRVRRWNNILASQDGSLRSVQFASLSLGYVVNFFIPYKLGELLRAVLYSFWGKKDFSSSLASVVFERLVDILVWTVIISVAVTFVLSSETKSNDMKPSWLISLLAILGIVFCFFMTVKSPVKYVSNQFSSIFNDEISYHLRCFFWSLGESFIRVKGNFLEFAFNTISMWVFYLLSYYMLSISLDVSIATLISSLFNVPLSTTISIIISHASLVDSLLVSLYFLAPVVFISLYLFVKNKYSYQPKRFINWFSSQNIYLPDKKGYFADKEQFHMFLLRNFRNDMDIISQFYRCGMEDKVVLHRIFHGGSDALTTLIEKFGQLYVRKFSSNLNRGELKLLAQKEWLAEHEKTLPLAKISNEQYEEGHFFYDMPYNRTSIDFYEFIHTVDIDHSWGYLQQVLSSIGLFHKKNLKGDVAKEIVCKYLNDKLINNFIDIKELACDLFRYQSVTINGQKIDLIAIEEWLTCSDFYERFQHRQTSIIHGDLTIENIIIDQSTEPGWFIIDPNVGNLFDSPLLDYAKLMQSLNLGYESLNRSIDCQYHEDILSVSFYRSSQYSALSEKYEDWLKTTFSPKFLSEVKLHEIIHYMRLIPYKFRKDKRIGIAFTACMLLLVDEFMREYY